MAKLIAAMNMTLDGYCDHTAMIADDEIHDHYTDLLRSGGAVIYGRKTFQLMEYWKSVLENPTGNKSMDEFAEAIDEGSPAGKHGRVSFRAGRQFADNREWSFSLSMDDCCTRP